MNLVRSFARSGCKVLSSLRERRKIDTQFVSPDIDEDADNLVIPVGVPSSFSPERARKSPRINTRGLEG